MSMFSREAGSLCLTPCEYREQQEKRRETSAGRRKSRENEGKKLQAAILPMHKASSENEREQAGRQAASLSLSLLPFSLSRLGLALNLSGATSDCNWRYGL